MRNWKRFFQLLLLFKINDIFISKTASEIEGIKKFLNVCCNYYYFIENHLLQIIITCLTRGNLIIHTHTHIYRDLQM